jgi:hypothetical protein
MNRIDFRLIQRFGLSLNTKKKYFMIFDPQSWTLNAVYDNLEDACKDVYQTVEEWEQQCDKNAASSCPYTQKYNREFVGHNYTFYKGFFQNLSVWDLLEQLRYHILDEYLWFEDQQEAIEYTMSRIDSKLQSYPDIVETPWAKI